VKSLKNVTLLLLALTSIGGAILAWQQYQELVGSARLGPERGRTCEPPKAHLGFGTLQQGIERPARRAAVGKWRRTDGRGGRRRSPTADGAPEVGRGQNRSRGGNPQQMFKAMRDLMAKPEVQALRSVQQKAAIDARYASLFKGMNLSAEQAER
jgi:hypothetical protein